MFFDCLVNFNFVAAHSLLEQSVGKTNSPEDVVQTDLNPAGPSTNKGKSINVLVTSGSLVPSLAKCLLYRLDNVIPAKNGSSFLIVRSYLLPFHGSLESIHAIDLF